MFKPTLTQFIRQKEISAKFRQLISIPPNQVAKQNPVVPSSTVHPAMMGMAFDLLMRCCLFREYSKYSKMKWDLRLIERYAYYNKPQLYDDADKEIKRYFKVVNPHL
jgi:hypothetical protein